MALRKLVRDVMVRDIVTISPFSTLREALLMMRDRNVKSLVVDRHDSHDAFGLLTYTHILKTIIAEEGDIDLVNVYDVCAKPALSVHPDLATRHAAHMMHGHNVKRLLVTENNQAVGIITTNDLVRDVLRLIEQ
ncbi:CBS domain-containing protein [Chromatocurvus halotolerans]|uniref:CBS domain protein n=1 Tax=Chromatocurvus halotolerans TaxID=1132028 RepID=A0A4R2L8C1_9GAMM|nr:CBS domain-containing protein [Chromatocurvus halotolerans]TCO75485.1 CBS domain protein [Chromatocurvus halotolerans]